MTFAERVEQLRRRMVVELLAESPGSGHSVWLLRSALADLNQHVTASEMARLADWLAAAGLVEFVTRELPPVLRATEQGIAAAAEDIVVRGIARKIP